MITALNAFMPYKNEWFDDHYQRFILKVFWTQYMVRAVNLGRFLIRQSGKADHVKAFKTSWLTNSALGSVQPPLYIVWNIDQETL